jgi:hypothetical protein
MIPRELMYQLSAHGSGGSIGGSPLGSTSTGGGSAASNAQMKKLTQGMGEAILGGLHWGLDGVGLVPGLGEIADGINAGIYWIEGDKVNLYLGCASKTLKRPR